MDPTYDDLTVEEKACELIRAGFLSIRDDGTIWRHGYQRPNGVICRYKIAKAAERVTPRGGYLRLFLVIDGHRRDILAHRLIWTYANGAIPEGLTINHKNGKRQDNRLENLEVMTRSENALDAVARLGDRWNEWHRGERHRMAKLTYQQVRVIRAAHSYGCNQRRLAESFCVNPATINDIVQGRHWREHAEHVAAKLREGE